MTRTLTEHQVLRRLGIPDFRHMTKDKIIKFASMLHKMDREVAIKALEQFPEFADATKDIVAFFKETLIKGFDENNASQTSFYQTCDSIINSLEEMKNDELTFEEKQIIIDKMLLIANMKAKKDSENKEFILKLGGLGAFIVVIVTAITANTIGGQIDVNADSFDDQDFSDVA